MGYKLGDITDAELQFLIDKKDEWLRRVYEDHDDDLDLLTCLAIKLNSDDED